MGQASHEDKISFCHVIQRNWGATEPIFAGFILVAIFVCLGGSCPFSQTYGSSPIALNYIYRLWNLCGLNLSSCELASSAENSRAVLGFHSQPPCDSLPANFFWKKEWMRSDYVPLFPPSLLIFAVNPASVINLIVTASFIFSPSPLCTLGEPWKWSKAS